MVLTGQLLLLVLRSKLGLAKKPWMFEKPWVGRALPRRPASYKKRVVRKKLSPAPVLEERDQRQHNRGWMRREVRAHWSTLVAVIVVVAAVVTVVAVPVSETAEADIESDHQS